MIIVLAALLFAGIGGAALVRRVRSNVERDIETYARGRDALTRLHEGQDHLDVF